MKTSFRILLRSEIGRSMAAMVLRSGGYLVTEVVEDDPALRIARSRSIDAVIVDLPMFRGVQLTRRLHAQQPNILILLISSIPSSLHRQLDVPILDPASIEDDLVSRVDLMLAHPISVRSAEGTRRVAGAGRALRT
jgi:CheY-like chemotaxis protein